MESCPVDGLGWGRGKRARARSENNGPPERPGPPARRFLPPFPTARPSPGVCHYILRSIAPPVDVHRTIQSTSIFCPRHAHGDGLKDRFWTCLSAVDPNPCPAWSAGSVHSTSCVASGAFPWGSRPARHALRPMWGGLKLISLTYRRRVRHKERTSS
ncbi:hypothetical protein LZ31DRAFT_256275 [Colletotrichum somersetense]|nr:hypothetical protein LZ31DRAFT_256275 [Colletotrichum somersetense]